MPAIRRALISVYDKSGVRELAEALSTRDVEILSTGGTARLLEETGVRVTSVSEYTGQEEILGGRVKTLHPRIFGGILHRRSAEPEAPGSDVPVIDLVAVNLYPFRETVAAPDVTLEDALENIDIGGVSLLRAAAKNFQRVVVLSDPGDYPEILKYLDLMEDVPEDVRRRLAVKAFLHTTGYDGAISQHLQSVGQVRESNGDAAAEDLPPFLPLGLERVLDLRYGENPHQRAALYRPALPAGLSVLDAEKLQGKELSYNNLLDLGAAAAMALEFTETAAVVVKHNNPCGVAAGEGGGEGEGGRTAETLAAAFDADRMSAFGGIVVLNRPLGGEAAEILAGRFLEVLAAPDFDDEALETLKKKKDLRVLRWPALASGTAGEPGLDVRSVPGGVLVQQADRFRFNLESCEIPTKRKPTVREFELLAFAWRVVKHVKSNAILLAGPAGPESGMVTLGVGAGQMSRVDSVKLAVWKAREAGRGEALPGSVLASDAFFPFRDGVDAAAEAGVAAVVQPGGSKRDEEVIAAADEAGVAMVLTGMRHFRH
ncbi:MAG: bifunctional phosphoribosylaminoimidazolecarboxamide formyltransferase/IMP cyclohydrolase [Nitrospinota bacterium]|jgi:phosphoribosylaminoimidazolecarboxamide formyltransferase/IMP cyclohydrolase|nr:bifunctional phosphoribosylaminoimidazolecarboxamide formyltransferase/IMP cyclohydrolase [Nitrospinota bacterium]HJM42019.1 bifunctional phosphoribosylaminoimidazolecarboxamide formyltransferase/IMP cyclohydrolase [Nitrospinota bacterium]